MRKLLLATATVFCFHAAVAQSPPVAGPEQRANKDQPNGYPGLDSSGLLKQSEMTSALLSAVFGYTPTQGVVSIRAFSPHADGVTDDSTAFQSAIAYIQSTRSGCGTILVNAGNYAVNGQLLLASCINLEGEGISATTLTQIYPISGPLVNGVTSQGKHLIELAACTSGAVNNTISDMTLVGAGIQAQCVTNLRIARVKVSNTYEWGFNIGDSTSTESTFRNFNVVLEDVSCNGSNTALECVLMFQTQHAYIVRLNAQNGTAQSTPAIGLYQNDDDIHIINEAATAMGNCGYYSQSTNDIYWEGGSCTNSAQGIKGANQSDHGNFGWSVVKNLNIKGMTFSGLTNTYAIEVGAVDGCVIADNYIYNNWSAGIALTQGNNTGPGPAPNAPATNCHFRHNTLRDNNQVNTSPGLNPGILFKGIGGALYDTFEDNNCEDDQGTPTQLYCVSFSGAFTWSNIAFIGGALNSYSTGLPVATLSGAILSGVIASDLTAPSQARTVTTSTDTMQLTDQLINFDNSTGVNETIPACVAGNGGRTITFYDLYGNAASNPDTLTPANGNTIAGLSSYTFAKQGGSVSFRCNGTGGWG